MRFFSFILVSFFSLPLVLLAGHIRFSELILDNHLAVLGKTAWFTLVQAGLSAAICVLAGVALAPSYAALGSARRFVRWGLLLPNLMPSILVVLAILTCFEKVSFPFGLTGILLGHVFLNVGLSIVLLGEAWARLRQDWGPLNAVLGVQRIYFFRRAFWPFLKAQMGALFAVIFVFCLSSFAIPLVLGGGPQFSTLEVLIYEFIRTDTNISWATLTAALQSILQVLMLLVVLNLSNSEASSPLFPQKFKGIESIPVILFTSLLLYPIFKLLITGMGASRDAQTDTVFVSALHHSLAVAVGTGALTFLVLSVLLCKGWDQSLSHFPAWSGVVIGLAGVLLFKVSSLAHQGAYLFALLWGHFTLLFLPVFRLFLPVLGSIRRATAPLIDQMGVRPFYAAKKIYLRRGLPPLLTASSLAACWSMGEFSIAQTLGVAQGTLPVYIQSQLSAYRLEAAAASSTFLMAITFVSLLATEWLTRGGELGKN